MKLAVVLMENHNATNDRPGYGSEEERWDCVAFKPDVHQSFPRTALSSDSIGSLVVDRARIGERQTVTEVKQLFAWHS